MAIRMKAFIDAQLESKRNADYARRTELYKAILEAKKVTSSFTSDLADIIDTYKYIVEQNGELKYELARIIDGSDYGFDLQTNDDDIYITTKKSLEFNYYICVTRNEVKLRTSKSYSGEFDLNELTTKEAELYLSHIRRFNKLFPTYVRNFYLGVEKLLSEDED